MLTILSSDFFWGIFIGLLLSIIGSYSLAYFSHKRQKQHQRAVIIVFFKDSVENIAATIAKMDETRDRSKAIHHDFLNLIDIEITIYGRNREHMVLLPDDTRENIRTFMNNCAIKRAEIQNKLQDYYDYNRLADQVQSQGRGPEASRLREAGTQPLTDAQRAADQLTVIGKDAKTLIQELASL